MKGNKEKENDKEEERKKRMKRKTVWRSKCKKNGNEEKGEEI